jgi:hypothetical protein
MVALPPAGLVVGAAAFTLDSREQEDSPSRAINTARVETTRIGMALSWFSGECPAIVALPTSRDNDARRAGDALR